jgi:hypothetical protein
MRGAAEMPRANGKGAPPQRIEDTLLVVQPFRAGDGKEYLPCDRHSMHTHRLRSIALQNPELFVMEYETAPVDMTWLTDLDRQYDEQYAEFKHVQGTKKERQEKALRAEFEAQNRDEPSQRELERRYKRQEAEREKRLEQVREAQEREAMLQREAQGATDEVGACRGKRAGHLRPLSPSHRSWPVLGSRARRRVEDRVRRS